MHPQRITLIHADSGSTPPQGPSWRHAGHEGSPDAFPHQPALAPSNPPTFLPAHWPGRLPTHSLAQAPAFPPAGPPTCLPTSPPDWTPAHPSAGPRTHLPILVVNKDVAGAVVLQVGDLQAVGVANLGWLEGGVQMFNLHDGLGLLGLEARPWLSSRWAWEQAVQSCGCWLGCVALGKVLNPLWAWVS